MILNQELFLLVGQLPEQGERSLNTLFQIRIGIKHFPFMFNNITKIEKKE